ncbi:M1 family metallopeptidase [Streptomyces gamaensis]|uniref:M1 family metallopeptidase n=1 Tax=Streptomyces gamaensis TaxID=1763542 RepID=A0ABW0YY49_9ACTN
MCRTAARCFPHHGSDDYRVRRYRLRLDWKPGSGRILAVAELTVVPSREMRELAFDLARLRVSRVGVDGAAARFRQRKKKLLVATGRVLPAGEPVRAVVHYHGVPRPVGVPELDDEAGWFRTRDGVRVMSEPVGAPSWFPCNDRPDDKAAYRIEVTAPERYQVCANGRLALREPAGGRRTRWVYEHDGPMAPYLATVAIGRFVFREQSGGPAGVRLRNVFPERLAERAAHDFGRQPLMLRAFTGLFGPYPFEEYGALVVDDRVGDPLEWLWAECCGEAGAHATALGERARLRAVGGGPVLGDPAAGELYDDRLYSRGALTLHALRTVTGDAVFFPMVREWLARNRGGTADTPAFVAHAQRCSGRSLEGFFRDWLHSPGLPELPVPDAPVKRLG